LLLLCPAEVPSQTQKDSTARSRQSKAAAGGLGDVREGRWVQCHYKRACALLWFKVLHISVHPVLVQCADLAPIYEHVCSELGLQVDASKLAGMKERNAIKLAELEAKIADAQENLGETEVRDALLAKAEFLADIGDREAATKAFEAAEAKTAGSGNKMDLVFSQIR
jgi:hypothetical protein